MPMSSERLLSHFTLWQYVLPYIRDGTSSFHLQVKEKISNLTTSLFERFNAAVPTSTLSALIPTGC